MADKPFTVEQEEMILDRYDIVAELGYNQGVIDARKQMKDPDHHVWYMRRGNKNNPLDGVAPGLPSTQPAATATARTPTALAQRANEIQTEAEKKGERIGNIEACQMAYAEAGIAWK